MIYILDLCTNSNVLTIFLFIKYLFTIICILLPIIIMYRLITSMYKVVISGNKIADQLSLIFKNILAALIIFLLPSLFSFIFTDLVPVDSSISACFTNSTIENIEKYRDAEEQERKENAAKYKEELNEAMEEAYEKEKEKNEILKEQMEKREELFGSDDDDDSSTSSIPGSSNTTLKSAAKNIIIGDSRTVGMCATLTLDWTNCQYNNGGAFITGDDIYIAQGSMGYSWFESEAIGTVNSIIAANPGTTYNIYSLMGVNFLLYDIDKYIPKYNELAEGAWSNHNLILVSVNPVNEEIEAQHGYSTKQANIITFNTKLKNGTSGVSNIKYCDTYSKVIDDLVTPDGLHYGESTYKAIYNAMMSCGG